jgi:hypothetical protein
MDKIRAELLKKPLWNVQDIRMYVGCSYRQSRKIINKINQSRVLIASTRQVPSESVLNMLDTSREKELGIYGR